MANADLREFAKTKGVRLWEIANYLQLSEATMTRALRTELDDKSRDRFMQAVEAVQRSHDEKEAESDA